jgi:hypothetical protein
MECLKARYRHHWQQQQQLHRATLMTTLMASIQQPHRSNEKKQLSRTICGS